MTLLPQHGTRPAVVDTAFPNLPDSLWDDCIYLLYGSKEGGFYNRISDSDLSLPSGVSWSGNDLYFDQSSTAYFSLTGSLAAMNSSGNGTLAIIAKPYPNVGTDLRAFGCVFGPGYDGRISIWWDEKGSDDSWAGAGYLGDQVYSVEESTQNEFQLVAVTQYQDTSGGTQLCVNGSVVGEEYNSNNTFPTAGEVELGKVGPLTPNFKGWMRFAATWSRKLSNTEMAELYSQTAFLCG